MYCVKSHLSLTDLRHDRIRDSLSSPEYVARPVPRFYLTLNGLSGLVLAICFFLPISGSRHNTPLRLFWIQLGEFRTNLHVGVNDLVFDFCAMPAMHLLGALIAVEMWSSVWRLRGVARFCRAGVSVTLALIGVGLIWVLPALYLEERTYGNTWLTLSSACLAVLALAGAVAGRLSSAGGVGFRSLVIGIVCTMWCGLLIFSPQSTYGAAIAGVASLMLVFSSAASILNSKGSGRRGLGAIHLDAGHQATRLSVGGPPPETQFRTSGETSCNMSSR